MFEYRISLLDSVGQRTYGRLFLCQDDQTALTLAAQMIQGDEVAEVSLAGRLVGRVTSSRDQLLPTPPASICP